MREGLSEHGGGVAEAVRRVWIDERQRSLPRRPWRKVHLDFQLDELSQGVGADFDADAFAATLLGANVDAIVVFAKNTCGWCFYPSEIGPVHPHLVEPDLLGKQVAACRAAGIKVQAYYSYAWDEQLAERHPEWLVWKRDRTTYLPALDAERFWTPLCISHPGLLELALAHTSEVLERYPVDGVWYDMVFPVGAECYCPRCVSQLREAGEDPLDREAQRRHKDELHTELLRRIAEHVRGIRPECEVEHNAQACLGLADRVALLDNVDIEALPTGGWGYGYFPLHARYARTHGRSVYGMSGKFARSWGDYGGLKHPTQLRTELAGIVAQGLRCDIGDQPLPGCRLDAATYHTIGAAYGEIARLEPWLEGAVPATEAAILVDGPRLARLASLGPEYDERIPSVHAPAVGGLATLLSECQVQFDVVDSDAELERYALIALPDSLDVGAELAQRLNAHLAGGGALIGSHAALRSPDGDGLWPVAFDGVTVAASPFVPAFMRLEGELFADLPQYADHEFALYGSADRWDAGAAQGVELLGRLGEPAFQRFQDGWQSAPPAVQTQYASALLADGVAGFSFALASAYFEHGYWFYRELFERTLARLLPRPLVRTSAPASAEVTLTQQRAEDAHGERWIVHVVNYSPLRRAQGRMEYLEDPIPLCDVEITLDRDVPIGRVYEVRSGSELAFQETEAGWRTTVPRVPVAATVVYEARGA
ncbi:MAG TPA: alpha-amylase family protein [Conexibacter sp.]|jgi:hypothetical protein|nr:alpha-amylase family protein [Conexibacter sp.]